MNHDGIIVKSEEDDQHNYQCSCLPDNEVSERYNDDGFMNYATSYRIDQEDFLSARLNKERTHVIMNVRDYRNFHDNGPGSGVLETKLEIKEDHEVPIEAVHHHFGETSTTNMEFFNNYPSLTRVIGRTLRESFDCLESLQDGASVIQEGGAFGELGNDTEIKADACLGEMITALLQEEAVFGRITVEGFEDVYGEGDLWACVDPLDGSLNYATKGDTLGLPYSTCITFLSKKENARFSDVITAGVIDLRNENRWIVESVYGTYRTHLAGKVWSRTKTHPATKLDLGKMIVIGEMYYPENREKLFYAFRNDKGWLRSPGSAAYEMALVSSGQIAAYICDRQKQHELGAAYALVKGAGGVAVDFEGKDLGERVYDFKTQTPVILAANMDIAGQILERMAK